MNQLTLQTKTVVTACTLTADNWQLYSASMNCGPAVRGLNAAVKRLSRTAATRTEFLVGMTKVMDRYCDYGAADSEPRWVVDEIADTIYGSDFTDLLNS